MARGVKEFPTVAQLFQGAVLATIANALFAAGTEGGAYEHSWDGDSDYGVRWLPWYVFRRLREENPGLWKSARPVLRGPKTRATCASLVRW